MSASANEGKMITVVPSKISSDILNTIKVNILGRDAAVTGEVVDELSGMVTRRNVFGYSR